MFKSFKSLAAVLALGCLALPQTSQAEQTRSVVTTATHIETSDLIYDAWAEYIYRRPHAADLGYNYSPLAGMYSCNIDGRRGTMGFGSRGYHLTRCDRNKPDVCTLSTGWGNPTIQWRDHGWQGEKANNPFIFPTFVAGGQSNITMRHPNGNTWFLNVTEFLYTPTYRHRFTKRLEGYTTWRGRQYPLSCDRVQNGAPPLY